MPRAPHALRFAVLATDTVLFRIKDRQLEVLLVPAAKEVFPGKEAVPGGLIRPEEVAEEAASRILHEKADVDNVHLEQLYTFSRVDRDPRGRVVSVAYLGVTNTEDEPDKGREVRWCALKKLPKLAYDHDEIVGTALERMRARVSYSTIAQHLLPKEFTLTDLQQVYEDVLGHELDKRNFRKKVLALKLLKETGRKRTQGASRPAELYSFARKNVQNIEVL